MNKAEFKVALYRKGKTQAQMAHELNDISESSRWTEAKLSRFVNGLWPNDAKSYVNDAKTICSYLGVELKHLFPELAQKKMRNKSETAQILAV